MNERYSEIDDVIAYIHEHIYEPLSLSKLAEQIAYSPYHFTRIFKERIGLSPLHYVSSLRLQKAKELLLHTDLTIRDIGLEIGQQSLGTFTTRFTERVGVRPSDFRNSMLAASEHLKSLKELSARFSPHLVSKQNSSISGTIHTIVPFEGIILIGLFAKPIPEGLPLYGTLLFSLGDFNFRDIKPGIYYMMATSVSWTMKAHDVLLPQTTTLRSRLSEPIIVEPYSIIPHQQIVLHTPRLSDPPILISLPLLMNNFLNQVQGLQNY